MVPSVIRTNDLPRTEHSHEFVGADHQDVPFSIILVNAPPGAGPGRHRHPYAEVFVVESGEATFELGDDHMVVHRGEIVVGPPNILHGFTNTGTQRLRLTSIHGAAEFDTEWLADADPAWVSKRGG
jgi:quercetin dioxygenase-like cupin family protein